MKHKVEIRPRAAMDIFEGFDKFESITPGMGNEFLEELEVFFSEMLVNPFTYAYYDTPVRLGNVNKFPYTVYFEVFIESIVVYGVFMTQQAYENVK